MPRKSKRDNTVESPEERATRLAARCLGVLALKDSPKKLPSDTERIGYLSALGFEDSDIAAILGTTVKTVQTRLSELRRAEEKKNRKRGKAKD